MKKIIAKIISSGDELLTIDEKLLEIGFSSLDRGSAENTISYGLYENSGEIRFSMPFEAANTLISAQSKLVVEIYLIVNNFNKKLAEFFVNDVFVSQETNEMRLVISDGLQKKQEVDFAGKYFFDKTTLSNIAKYVDDTIEADSLTQHIYCPNITKDTEWGVLSSICEASMARGFKENGKLKIKRDEPNGNFYEKPIIIYPRNILKIQNETAFYKNQIPSISLEYIDRRKYTNSILGERQSFRWFEWTGETFSWDGVAQLASTLTNEEDEYFITAKTEGRIQIPETTFYVDPNLHISARRTSSTGASVSIGTNSSGILKYTPTNQSVLVSENYADVSFSDVGVDKIVSQNYPLGRITSGYAWVSGDYYTDLSNGEVWAGNYNITPQKLATNDLVQRFNTVSENSEQLMCTEMTEYARRRYWGGVDCCEMECLFSNYYDTDGNLVFSAEQAQSFSKYDVVVPYVYKNGESRPYKSYSDGTPKKFIIIGIKYRYVGIPTQTLVLQEYARYSLSGTWKINKNPNTEPSDKYNDGFEERFGADSYVSATFYNPDKGYLESLKVSHIFVEDDGTLHIVAEEMTLGHTRQTIYQGATWYYDYNDGVYEIPSEEVLNSVRMISFGLANQPILSNKYFYEWLQATATKE